MDILIGILVLILGAGVATLGLRIWFWMLPILGFMIGFFLGAILIANWLGDGILSTMLSWIVGIIAGVAFALISWLWWYTGAIIAAGASGALLATAIAASFGVDTQWVLAGIALIGALLLAMAAIIFALPIYVVIVNTAIAGAVGVISGLLLIIDRIDVDELGSGHTVAIIDDSLGWWLLWLVAAGIGIAVQIRTTAIIALPAERYVPTSNAVRYESDREQRAS